MPTRTAERTAAFIPAAGAPTLMMPTLQLLCKRGHRVTCWHPRPSRAVSRGAGPRSSDTHSSLGTSSRPGEGSQDLLELISRVTYLWDLIIWQLDGEALIGVQVALKAPGEKGGAGPRTGLLGVVQGGGKGPGSREGERACRRGSLGPQGNDRLALPHTHKARWPVLSSFVGQVLCKDFLCLMVPSQNTSHMSLSTSTPLALNNPCPAKNKQCSPFTPVTGPCHRRAPGKPL